ncbi:MAG: hypothetical protein EB167_04155 [Nitrososphaeria archaeon]|nr:hypothetical protein [Nitrososphaeria archaeon]
MQVLQQANHLFLNRQFSDAVALYDQILNVDPKNLDAINNKGYALGKMKKHQEAIAVYDFGLSLYPNERTLRINKISSLRKLKMYQDALDNCDAILGESSNDNIVLYHKERILYSIGRYSESSKCCDEILLSYPENSEVLFDKAIALAMTKDEDCIPTLGRAVHVDPNLKIKAKHHGAFSDHLHDQDFLRLVSD